MTVDLFFKEIYSTIRLITKSCRIWYCKLIVNNIRKVVFLVSYVLSIFFLITSSHLSLRLKIPLNLSNQFIGDNYCRAFEAE